MHHIEISLIGKKLDTKKRGWNKAIVEQFANLEKTIESKKDSYAVELHFDSGDVHHFLFLNSKNTPFERQTFLRKKVGFIFSKDSLKKDANISVHLESLDRELQSSLIEEMALLSELTYWEPKQYGKRAEKKEKITPQASLKWSTSLKDTQRNEIIREATLVASGHNLVRSLAMLPSNELSPDPYVAIVREKAKELKSEFEYLDSKKLHSLKAGAFLAVIQGSPDERGGIVHLSHEPKGAKKSICFVGKGLCFDTGGNNIKTGDYMYEMHRDMTGSAVALALFELVVKLKLPVNVHAYLAIAENLVSPISYRPNDIVVASNGVSIEVVNTDAEGRMVLSDTLYLASKHEPDLILDFATLTGSAVRAVGTARSAVFSNQERLGRVAQEAGDSCGERVWGFPIGGDYTELLKSETADTLQCSNAPQADHILAATFLSKFVGKTPWVHCDLSSESHKGGLGLVPTEVTGFGVRFGLSLTRKVLGV